MTKLVQQKTGHDCALACIAMAVGKTHEEAWTQADLDEVVKARGVASYEPWMTKHNLVVGRDWREMYVEHMAVHSVRALLWKRRAILSVWSLNNDGGHHAVYWDGRALFDPSTQRTFQFLSSVSITRVILLGDENGTCRT